MKKLLSLLLTICLLIAVTVIPVPAMAATGEILFEYGDYGITDMPISHTIGEAINYPELPANSNGILVWSLYPDVYEEPPTILEYEYLQVYAFLLEGIFNFENYSPDRWIAMSGRVAPFEESDGNTVIMFNNNGIPYRSSDIDTSNSYTKKDGTYTKVTNPDSTAYSTYYHASAMKTDFVAKNGNTMEAYNAIELSSLKASTSYKVTINYKRESLVNPLYVQPVTWSPNASLRDTMYLYNDARITINATDTADSDYVTVSTVFTTPEAFLTYKTNVGNKLRLVLFTGVDDANNVVYFDNITVEEVATVDLTCHYADSTTKVIGIEAGEEIPSPDANRLGENGGIWYADAQGSTPAPAVMPPENLDVYEVVNTGVFDFNNYYNYADYNGNNSDFAVSNSTAFEVADGVLKYDSSKSTENTMSITGRGRINSIAIGEAKENTTYKITVYYKRGASENAIIFTPLTGMKTLTSAATKEFYDSVSLSATETADSEYQKAEIVVTTAATFAEIAVYGGKSNCFYLNVATETNGQTSNVATLDIDKITVEEYVDSDENYTVTLNRGGVIEEVPVEKGTEYTLPDTKFTDTSWWNAEDASSKDYFVGYEGEKVTVNADVTYYTAETYSDGETGIYRNWTGLDTTTEDFSYFYVNTTSEAKTEWKYSGSSRVCTRLGVVEDGKTYRISVTYKATTDADIDFYMLTTDIGNSGGGIRNYLEDGKIFHTVGANTDGWETVTFYITADLPGEIIESENGLDDTKNVGINCGLYLTLGKGSGRHNIDLAIKETKVEDMGVVVTTKGASVLKDENVVDGKQAIRYYFNYKTENEGADIVIGSESYEIVERGFIITNGAISNYGLLNTNHNKYYYYSAGNSQYGYADDHFIINLGEAKAAANKETLTVKSVSGEDLKKLWSLDGDTVTFSNYLINIPQYAYNAKFLVKGFVTFKDAEGNEHTVYSKSVNRSVNGITNVLAQRH